jgi:hypothetical protein
MIERPGLHGQRGGSSPYAVYQGVPATATTAAVPACPVPPALSTANVWYFDPVNGKSPAAWVTYFAANPSDAGRQGDAQHPWNSLIGAISGYWGTANVTPNVTYPGYSRPLLSSVPFWHTTTTGEAGLNAGEAIGKVDVADNTGSPPIHPGDKILLMSGNYGNIFIGAYTLSTVNSDWVTVQAAPGQTPVLATLYAEATNKWVFSGLTVQSIKTAKPVVNYALVSVTDEGTSYPATDFIFDNMSLSSAPSATAVTWTAANWFTNARAGFVIEGHPGNGTNGEPGTSCISITHSHIFNVAQGAILEANSVLFSNNELDHFVDDGIDYMGNNIAITKTSIHDAETDNNGNHPDAIQGNAGSLSRGVAYNQYSNILIDSNMVIRRTDPTLSLPTEMQGISQFDADYTNVTITNNVVITRACYGLEGGSDYNALIANNTVLDDGDTSIPEPGCGPVLLFGGTSHQEAKSTNVRVSNNLADTFSIDDEYPANIIIFDHNVALNSYHSFAQWVNGVGVYRVAAGPDANGNITPATSVPYASVFNTWLPTTWQYNVALLPGSVAKGAGTSGAPLPTIDITGATRTSPHSVGAYQ